MLEINRTIIHIPYTEHTLTCPFCGSGIDLTATVVIEKAGIRRTGTEDSYGVFTVDLDPKIVEIGADHVCKGKHE